MKPYLTFIIISALLLISCKKETEPQNSAASTNVIPFTEVGKQMQNENAITSQSNENSNSTNQNQPIEVAVPVANGMNPAHGQPLHRCDIAVGAPLNSPASKAKNTATPLQITPQQNQSTTTPVATTTTPEGMNPPHGQTNHNCDIAVGAPLPKT